MNGALQAKIDLALDALSFDAGLWSDESRERHLLEQIALAKKHLQTNEDFPLLKHDIELMEQALEWASGRMSGCLDKNMKFYLLKFVRGRLFEAREAVKWQEKLKGGEA